MMRATVNPREASQFEVVSCGELASVIDTTTGHPVTSPEPQLMAAATSQELNRAVALGPKALARALCGIEWDMSDDEEQEEAFAYA